MQPCEVHPLLARAFVGLPVQLLEGHATDGVGGGRCVVASATGYSGGGRPRAAVEPLLEAALAGTLKHGAGGPAITAPAPSYRRCYAPTGCNEFDCYSAHCGERASDDCAPINTLCYAPTKCRGAHQCYSSSCRANRGGAGAGAGASHTASQPPLTPPPPLPLLLRGCLQGSRSTSLDGSCRVSWADEYTHSLVEVRYYEKLGPGSGDPRKGTCSVAGCWKVEHKRGYVHATIPCFFNAHRFCARYYMDGCTVDLLLHMRLPLAAVRVVTACIATTVSVLS
jgi:hypothetical protein